MQAFIFSGQGAPIVETGGALFDRYNELTDKADQILGYSIKTLYMRNSGKLLLQTQYAQPALFVFNALSYLNRLESSKKKPDYLAGHSLGEYVALFAAGVFDFETGLKLVQKRGEVMSRITSGGMAAITGLSEEQINDTINSRNLQNIQIANLNSPFQIVISGLNEDLDKAQKIFQCMKDVKLYMPLTLSGPFHSRFMEDAKREFASFLKNFNYHKAKIPVISNLNARPYQVEQFESTLIDQMTNPVKWTDSIRYLMGKGVVEFEEIGAGKVLARLVQCIQNESIPLLVDDKNVQSSLSASTHAVKSNSCPILMKILPSALGSKEFKDDYNLKYPYIAGGMYRGVGSTDIVIRMGKAGMLGFFGAGGLSLLDVEAAIKTIQRELAAGQAFGLNFIHNPTNPAVEERMIDLLLAYKVRLIEAAAFMNITPALVRYRAKGVRQDSSGNILIDNKIIAKVSRSEIARMFLSPAPEKIVNKLLSEKMISATEALLLSKIPMADDLCVEADSGGHTDRGIITVIMPAMKKLRDEMMTKYNYQKKVRLGAAGGIGTPTAVAVAFLMGADFIVTGSINQCTVEAKTSDTVKDLLQQINVQDTDYAPAGDMFEMGAKVQVCKKGLLFPARANQLYDLYRLYDSLDEIDEKTKKLIQEKYFKRNFTEVYNDCKAFYPKHEIEKAERNPKIKMAMIFKWYLGYSTQIALGGNDESKVDYQIHCGPALGAFNQWVKGTEIEDWKNRHVDEIGITLMLKTADFLSEYFQKVTSPPE